MTPYEIRNNLVTLANEYLQKQYETNKEFAEKTFQELVKQGTKVQEDYKLYMPQMYTFDEVVKKAQELYNFVGSNNYAK